MGPKLNHRLEFPMLWREVITFLVRVSFPTIVCWMQSHCQLGNSRGWLCTCWYRKVKCTRIQASHSCYLDFPGTESVPYSLSSFKSKFKKNKITLPIFLQQNASLDIWYYDYTGSSEESIHPPQKKSKNVIWGPYFHWRIF